MFGLAAAQSQDSRPNKLARLARSSRPEIRRSVARNPSSPTAALQLLSRDQDLEVLISVASNPSTPEEPLRKLALSKVPQIRVAVAGNHSSPPTLLAEMLTSRVCSPDERLALAKNAATPEASLKRIVSDRPSRELQCAVVSNTSAPADVLRSVLGAGDPRDARLRALSIALASNPATPSDIRARLFEVAEYREAVLRTAARESAAERIKHVWRAYRGSSVLSLLAVDEDPEVRRAVATSPHTPDDVLRILSGDAVPSVAVVATARISTNTTELQALARQQDSTVLEALARNPHTPDELRAELAIAILETAPTDLLQEIAKAETTPRDVQRRMAVNSNKAVRRALSSSSFVDPVALDMLSNDADLEIRKNVAANARLSLPSLARLSSDPDTAVRASVAANPSTPAELLLRLATDEAHTVAEAVGANANATPPIVKYVLDSQLERLVNTSPQRRPNHGRQVGFPVGPLLAVACNSNTAAPELRRLLDAAGKLGPGWAEWREESSLERRGRIWNGIAGNPSAPSDVLAAIAASVQEHLWVKEDPDKGRLDLESTREAILLNVVRNPSAEMDTLHSLSSGNWAARRTTTISERDGGHTYKWRVWDSAATADAIHEIARLVRAEISRRTWKEGASRAERLSFASAQDADSEVLLALSVDPDPAVRRAVASNSAAPPAAFARLAADASHPVRLAAASATHADQPRHARPMSIYMGGAGESTYREGFAALAQDPASDVRARVAGNGRAFWGALPKGARNKLAFDTELIVRSALLDSLEGRKRSYRGKLDIGKKALLHLISSGGPREWNALAARSYELPPEVLQDLVNTDHAESMVTLAEAYGTPNIVLAKLAESTNVAVVTAVSKVRPYGEERTSDYARIVEGAILRNPLAPESFVVSQASRARDEVVELVATHPNFPPEAFVRMVSGSDERWMRAGLRADNEQIHLAVAANTHAGADILRSAIETKTAGVREAVIRNPSTPDSLLVQIIEENAQGRA